MASVQPLTIQQGSRASQVQSNQRLKRALSGSLRDRNRLAGGGGFPGSALFPGLGLPAGIQPLEKVAEGQRDQERHTQAQDKEQCN